MRTLLACLVLFASANLQAALVNVVLEEVKLFQSGGAPLAIIGESTATWVYDTATGVVSGTGLYREQNQISASQPGQLFTVEIMDLSVGGGLAASAMAFDCIEGSLGATLGASICANISWGTNLINESTYSYGPGLAFERNVGGDDVGFDPMMNLTFYDDMITSIDGDKVILSNREFSTGVQMTFGLDLLPVPLPGAALLLLGGLGFLGGVGGLRKYQRYSR